MSTGDLVVPQGVALPVPGRGFEGTRLTKDDLEIPRAKLFQGTNEEVEKYGFSNDQKGMLFNSMTKEALPSRFVPFFFWRNYIRFNARTRAEANYDPAFDLNAILWRTNDPDDPRVIAQTCFGPNGEKPLAVTFLNFLALFPGVPMPLVIAFAKTSFAAGRHLASLAKWSQADLWARAYTLTTRLKTFDGGPCYVFVVDPAGASTDEESRQAEAWWALFSHKAAELKVHEEDENPDADVVV